MISTEEKAKFERIASLSSWDIAREYGCHFSGDVDPINHGGFFYDARDWDAYGYAQCVEFWEDYEHDCLVVQRGVINRPDDDDMESVWRGIGIDADSEERDNIHAQIEAARSYCGIEPDGTDYPELKNFRLEDWKEWRIWRSIDPWLRQLGSNA